MDFRRLIHWGPITALAIITVLFCVAITTIFMWLPPDNIPGVLHLLVFCIWVFNILKNFFKAVFMGPGHVPFKWKPVGFVITEEIGGDDWMMMGNMMALGNIYIYTIIFL